MTVRRKNSASMRKNAARRCWGSGRRSSGTSQSLQPQMNNVNDTISSLRNTYFQSHSDKRYARLS